MERIPRAQRDVLIRWLIDRDMEKVAMKLGVTPSAAYKCLNRGCIRSERPANLRKRLPESFSEAVFPMKKTYILFFGTLLVIPPSVFSVPQGDNAKTQVTLLRVPDRGIQPQAATDVKGTVHLIYYQGDAMRGEVHYVRSEDGKQFSKPIRVNRHPRQCHRDGQHPRAELAVGKNGRVHVAWMGSDQAAPRGPNKATPMLYSRLNDQGTAFEPERNVIRHAYGLDGGGSAGGGSNGNVYVAWHAPLPDTVGEANRCVWVAHSADEGKTFAAEKRANLDPDRRLRVLRHASLLR